MDTRIIKLDAHKPDLREIKEAARTIDNGGLVVFPTETVYGIACRAATEPLAKLTSLKDRAAEKHYTLHIGQKLDVAAYVPTISPVGRQLIKKGWPGPLTIVFELSDAELAGQRSRLGEDICDIVYKDTAIGIRCPDNVIASLLLSHTKHPVVAPSANLAGRPPATNGDTLSLAQLNGRVDMILDGGPCKYGLASTVVKINTSGIHLLRQGIYGQRDIEAMSAFEILFVCTGNTCRSPMAAGLCCNYLAQKLRCPIDQLDTIGYKIRSAATMGMSGRPASPEAIEVCRAKGVDIGEHRSSALSAAGIRQSDVIYVMCRQHRDSVLELCPEVGDKCFLLAANAEIPDPIGGSEKEYYYIAECIEQAIEKRLGEMTT